jgi:hypothetical protein
MTKDWKKIAQANGLAIPDADLERIQPALDALEAAFRPLVRDLAPALEPAVVFQLSAEDG